jgi:putative nucleotidyltransferase with HDIG domain
MILLNLVGEEKLKRMTHNFADAFGIPVALFGRERELLGTSSGEAVDLQNLSGRPILVRGSAAGYVAVPLSDDGAQAHLALMAETFSGMAETAYEIDSLSEEVARNYEELSLLWKFSSRLGAGLNVDTICRVLAEEVMRICPSKNVSIMLGEDSVGTGKEVYERGRHAVRQTGETVFLRTRVAVGEDAEQAAEMRLRTDRGLVGYSIGRREALTVCGVRGDRRFEGLPYDVGNILIVPLIAEEEAVGAIVASDTLAGEEFFSTEIKLIGSIAAESAMSIKKALLFEEVRTTLFSTVEAFAFAIDAKDPYTFGHSKRVSQIAVDIAKKMGLPSDMVTMIRLAALLHDIGKIGTPEHILHKVGELSPDEMKKMREHPLIGARMLEGLPRMKQIAVWICSHHERHDGSGYPYGVKGEAIPLPARIISLADNFDALTSDRAYRNAYGRDEAIEIMRRDVGVRFDPALFEQFREVV